MSHSRFDNSRCFVSIDTRFLFDLRRSLSPVYTRWACTVFRRRATYISVTTDCFALATTSFRRWFRKFFPRRRWRWWRWIKDDGSSLLSSHFSRELNSRSSRSVWNPSVEIFENRASRSCGKIVFNCLLMLAADQPWNAHHLMNYWKQGGREERDERSIT